MCELLAIAQSHLMWPTIAHDFFPHKDDYICFNDDVAIPETTIWQIEPHTAAKHIILRKYLDAWFPILAAYNSRVVYVDGFSGPGRYTGGEPGSPVIALESALTHRANLRGELVFLFI